MRAYKFPLVLSILIVSSFTHSHAVKFEIIDKFEREWKVNKNNVVNYDKLIGKIERNFLYGSCDPSEPNELDCTFVLDNLFSFRSDQRANMTCHLKLQGDESRQLFKNITVERFVSDSIFITWTTKDLAEENVFYDEYAFIHMPNCDKTRFGKVEDATYSSRNRNSRTSIGKSLSKFVLYRDSFDVIDYKKPGCEHNLCRLTHTSDGRTSNEFNFANDLNPWSIQPVNYDDDRDGFFVLSDNDTSPLVANVVDKSGEVQPMISIPKSAAQYWYPRYAKLRFSVCWTPETRKYFAISGNLHCSQHAYLPINDQHYLRRIMNVTVEVGPEKNTTVLGMHNVGGGGLLILTGRCDDGDKLGFACKGLTVLRIGEDGKKDSYELPEVAFQCQHPALDSMSIDIQQKGENIFHFLFAAICSDKSSDKNTIKLRRMIISSI